MGLVYRSLKGFWRTVVPRALNGFFLGGQSGFSRMILSAKDRLERTASHDELYDAEYYTRQEEEMATSSAGIAGSLKERLAPRYVIDVGCGNGAVLNAFREIGIQGEGLEYADAAL